jgi:NAD-dependent dihydropyrimidine dehydrogenase PreA subunit
LSNVALGLRVILGNGASGATHESRLATLRSLLENGYAVSLVERMPPAASDQATIVFAPEDRDSAEPQALIATLERVREERGLQPGGAWKPWFPVIDYQRCTNCMQCLSFCLFDVYGVSADGKIQVQRQNNCKTECPACSRVCPEVAIMFPKYRHGPINGDEVNTDDVRREAMKVDISALLGGDIYAALRDRSAKAKSRFSKERDEDRALKERQTCLVKLQQALDIPSEVLSALPSAEEIRVKAEAARQRALDAEARSAKMALGAEAANAAEAADQAPPAGS